MKKKAHNNVPLSSGAMRPTVRGTRRCKKFAAKDQLLPNVFFTGSGMLSFRHIRHPLWQTLFVSAHFSSPSSPFAVLWHFHAYLY